MRIFLTFLLSLLSLFTFFSPIVSACSLFSASDCLGESQIIYCPSGTDCSIDNGINTVKNGINDINTTDKFSVYVQNVVVYLLSFLAIVGVILGIYAGFLIMTSEGDETKVKTGRSIIKYVVFGFIVIFLAYSIVSFIIGTGANVNGKKNPGILGSLQNILLPTSYAAETLTHFDDYRKKIEAIIPEIDADYKKNNGKVSLVLLSRVQILVQEAMKTLPDDANILPNEALAKRVISDIDVVKKQNDNEGYLAKFAESLQKFLKEVKIPKITAEILATPNKGNAPLTTTLSARKVIDPSGVVISQKNIIWWTKGIGNQKNIIGTGPSVSTTFRDEKTYTVFVDILSSSRNTYGKMDIIPYTGRIDIQVEPRLADLSIYLNGTNVTRVETFKVTPAMARAGIIFDATASTPSGGTQFQRTFWDFGNNVTSENLGKPKIERANYYANGQYPVRMVITNNVGEKIFYNMNLLVVDPIASIRTDKTTGYANEEFRFAASALYSNSNISYEWSIREQETDKLILSANAQNISYKFPRTGRFEVRLKSRQANGKEDTDVIIVVIDPREPIVEFNHTKPSTETPNRIFVDATRSYDPDTNEGSKLNYRWTLDGTDITLENSSRNGAVGYFTINSLGNHKLTLEVSNGTSGKMARRSADIQIDSLLDVSLSIPSRLVTVGSKAYFIGESQNATTFEWFYGDGTSEILTEPRSSYVYKKSGSYDVVLKVYSPDGKQSNSITRRIYVTDADTPFAIISLKKLSDELSPTSNACGDQEAFVIDRSSTYTLSSELSTNIDGQQQGLSYTWKYLGKTALTKDVNLKFDELGCFPIDLTIRSNKNGKTSQARTFIKVQNLPPSLSSISVQVDKMEADPVIAKITANNAIDPDGVIVSYLWYYWTDADPEAQDFRITRTPQTSFVLPKLNGKYYFGVILEDSNGEKYSSQESSSQQYSLVLTSDNINTPILSLKTGSNTINLGKSVAFEVTAKNVMGNDISDKTQFKWDFDGDGFFDTTGTNKQETFTYTKPGTYQMKVKAIYKGVSNTRYQQIIVSNQIEPNYESYVVGKRVFLMNTSQGLYKTAKWNFGSEFTSDALQGGSFETSGDFPLRGTLEVSDGSSSKTIDIVLQKDVINEKRLERSKTGLEVFTFPSGIGQSKIVINSESDPFYIIATSPKSGVTFGIDTDLSQDTNLNGDPADDIDNLGTESENSGSPYLVKFIRETQSQKIIRVSLYDSTKRVIASQDITLQLNFVNETAKKAQQKASTGSGEVVGKEYSAQDKLLLEKLKELVRQAPEEERLRLQVFVGDLQEEWFDARDKLRILLDIEAFVDASKMDKKVKESIFVHLQSMLLSDSTTKDELTTSLKIISDLLPKTNPQYQSVMDMLKEIQSHPNDLNSNKKLATSILDIVKVDTAMSVKEKKIVQQQLKNVIYGGSQNVPEPENESGTGEESGAAGFVLNTFYIFLVLIFLAIGGVIFLFILYKSSNAKENFGFQDFLIERFFNKGSEDPLPVQESVVAPLKPKDIDPIAQFAPIQNSVQVEDPIQNPVSKSEEDSYMSASSKDLPVSELPSWLQVPQAVNTQPTEMNNTQEEPREAPQVQESSPQTEEFYNQTEGQVDNNQLGYSSSPDTSDLPSWLTPEAAQEAEKELEEIIQKQDEPPLSSQNESNSNPPPDTSDLPSWLLSSQEPEPLGTEVKSSASSLPDPIELPEIQLSSIGNPEIIQDSPWSSLDIGENTDTVTSAKVSNTPSTESPEFEIKESDPTEVPEGKKRTRKRVPKSPEDTSTSGNSLSSQSNSPSSPSNDSDDDLPNWLKL